MNSRRPIATPMGNLLPEKALKDLLKSIPLGRMGDPQDFARCVTSLIENGYMTGTVTRLDGGLRMGYL
jgi:NAD(P)-dependent dehydrogenase (short-subunit alcohol dehydrogenase family)